MTTPPPDAPRPRTSGSTRRRDTDPWKDFRPKHSQLPRATPFLKVTIFLACALIGALAAVLLGFYLVVHPLSPLPSQSRQTLSGIFFACSVVGALVGILLAAIYLREERRK